MAVWSGTRRPSDALTGEFVAEYWSAKVVEAVKSNLVIANLVDTKYQPDLVKGDTLHIPVTSTLTAADVSIAADWGATDLANMNTSFSDTALELFIDTWKEVPCQIDDMSARQAIFDPESRMAERAGYTMAKAIDTYIGDLWKGTGLTAYSGDVDGQTFSDDIMIALMETLDEADVPRDKRSLIIDPSTIADIYKIDKFVHASYVNKGPIATGNIGQIYGVPVYVTTNLPDHTTGHYGVLMHRDAIAFVMQSKPTIEKTRWAQRHSNVVNVSAAWGGIVARSTFGVYFSTRYKA